MSSNVVGVDIYDTSDNDIGKIQDVGFDSSQIVKERQRASRHISFLSAGGHKSVLEEINIFKSILVRCRFRSHNPRHAVVVMNRSASLLVRPIPLAFVHVFRSPVQLSCRYGYAITPEARIIVQR
jgi:hypothetical protein